MLYNSMIILCKKLPSLSIIVEVDLIGEEAKSYACR